jgi:hypothetical protein
VPDALTLFQLSLSAALLAVIVDRAYALLFAAPLSNRGVAHVLRALERAEDVPLRAFAARVARTHVGRVLSIAFAPISDGVPRVDALAELSFELSAEAAVRLRALRVGATIASTTGLLIGIIRLRGGFTKPPGLLALEAGLTERLAVADALFSMAIGVGTSAVCFYALSLLGAAARSLIAQRARVERALLPRLHAGPSEPAGGTASPVITP